MRLRKAAVALVLSAFTSVAPLALPIAEVHAGASVPTTACNGRSYQSLVKTYHYGAQKLALRCGTSSWGFIHIKHRWNATFDSMIALTIARGERVPDLQQDGGSVIFSLFDPDCNELFRVVYNGGAYNGNGVSPQGIITAYYIDNPAGLVLVGYRTDCELIQPI
jgi:hypothetical protein